MTEHDATYIPGPVAPGVRCGEVYRGSVTDAHGDQCDMDEERHNWRAEVIDGRPVWLITHRSPHVYWYTLRDREAEG